MSTNSGKGLAITSLLLSIFGFLYGWFALLFIVTGLLGVILSLSVQGIGIACLVMSATARRKGYSGGIKIPTIIFSIMTIVLGSVEVFYSGIYFLYNIMSRSGG